MRQLHDEIDAIADALEDVARAEQDVAPGPVLQATPMEPVAPISSEGAGTSEKQSRERA